MTLPKLPQPKRLPAPTLPQPTVKLPQPKPQPSPQPKARSWTKPGLDLILILGAFVATGFAIQWQDLGPTPAPFNHQMLPATEALIQGLVTSSRLASDGRPLLVVELADRSQITIYISDDVHASKILPNAKVSIRATLQSQSFATAVKPDSVTVLEADPEVYKTRAYVENEVAYIETRGGTARIAAPEVPNGVYRGQVLITDRGQRFVTN